jgi:hypothetical protein
VEKNQASGSQKQAAVPIFISDEDLRPKLIRRDNESHYILIKETTIINIYVPNVSSINLIKQILLDLKAQIDSNTTIVEDFNIPLSPMGRSPRQNKINKGVSELNDIYTKWT